MNFEIRRRYDRLAADISKMMCYFQKVNNTTFQDYPELAGVSIPSSIKIDIFLVDVPWISTQMIDPQIDLALTLELTQDSRFRPQGMSAPARPAGRWDDWWGGLRALNYAYLSRIIPQYRFHPQISMILTCYWATAAPKNV